MRLAPGTGVRYSTRTKSKLQFIQLVRVHRVMTPVPGEVSERCRRGQKKSVPFGTIWDRAGAPAGDHSAPIAQIAIASTDTLAGALVPLPDAPASIPHPRPTNW